MGDIFREIDEELRQERYEKLWREYGKYVVGAAVALVVAVAGYQLWHKYDTDRKEAQGAKFSQALKAMTEGRDADARAILESLSRETGSGVSGLARLHQAALLAKSGDRTGAVKIYDGLSADSGVDKPLRDLATILFALHSMANEKADIAALRERLAPLAKEKVPWRYSALELLGVLAQREGKTAEAKLFFQKIADDPNAPQGARGRATQMLAVING